MRNIIGKTASKKNCYLSTLFAYFVPSCWWDLMNEEEGGWVTSLLPETLRCLYSSM